MRVAVSSAVPVAMPPTKPPVIRLATAADVPAVAVLFDLYRQFYAQPADLPLARHFIGDRLRRGESVVWLAEAGSAEAGPAGAVGFCQLYPSFCSVEARPIYTLYDLYVVPAARKAGAGRLLLQAAEAHAAGQGAARLDLTTARDNAPAQALYESLGWVRDDVFFTYSRRLASSA